MEAFIYLRNLRVKGSILLSCLSLSVILVYIPFGRSVVRAVYQLDNPLAHRLMPHRAETPVSNYFRGADATVVKVAVVLIAAAIILIGTRDLIGFALSVATIVALFLVLFMAVDRSILLAQALHFYEIPYFGFRVLNIPDEELGFRERPFRHAINRNWRDWGYSPAYGIDIPPRTEIWETDQDGFRNARGVRFADVVVLGSSFPSYGSTLEDTYPKRLEAHLNGYTVSNLGLGGYGPVEFIKVYRRFGVPKKPRFAILLFQTGDIENSLERYVGGDVPFVAFWEAAFGSFWSRWQLALDETRKMAIEGSTATLGSIATAWEPEAPRQIHPDVAVLRLPGGGTKRTVFLSTHTGRSPQESLTTAKWRLFEKLVRDFKRISDENGIVPFLAYVPWASEVYAQYSTEESGANWMAVREKMIATSNNDDAAARMLAEDVGIEMIRFLPAFRSAASQGSFIYFQLDNHWDSEGSELAARVTADALNARFAESGSRIQTSVSEVANVRNSAQTDAQR